MLTLYTIILLPSDDVVEVALAQAEGEVEVLEEDEVALVVAADREQRDTVAQQAEGDGAALSDTLATFVADFARQVLAALLL